MIELVNGIGNAVSLEIAIKVDGKVYTPLLVGNCKDCYLQKCRDVGSRVRKPMWDMCVALRGVGTEISWVRHET